MPGPSSIGITCSSLCFPYKFSDVIVVLYSQQLGSARHGIDACNSYLLYRDTVPQSLVTQNNKHLLSLNNKHLFSVGRESGQSITEWSLWSLMVS